MATFKEAFREARNAGQKTFMWNGKRYTTELKEEAAKRTSPAKTAPSAGPRRNVEAEAKGAETLERMKSRAERGMSEEDSGMMSRLRRAGLTAKGAEEAGGLSSSAMAALGMAGGALGRGAKASKTASMARTEPRVGRPVTSRLDDAEAAFSRPQARQVSKDTGYTREPLPEKKMPKERTQFRSRTADRRDEREMRMAKGGVAKKRK